jgi:CHAD domain-containing protein
VAVVGAFVEVVELAGYPEPAARARRQVEESGAEALVGDVAGHAAEACGVDLAGVRIEPGMPLDADAPAIDGYRAVLANLREAIVANRPGAIDDVDPEFLHDLRVAVRRSRAVLAHAKHVLPAAELEQARTEFKWLGQITSAPRDLDVYQIEWPTYVESLPPDVVAALEPVRAHLEAERVAAYTTLASELGGRRANVLLERWGAWLSEPIDPAVVPRRGAKPLGRVVAKRIRNAHGAMVDDGRRITPTSPASDLHELRKDAKKLRYLVECFGGLYDTDARKPFVKRLKAMQDNLGEHQDAEVHVHQLGELATELGGTLPVPTVVAMGRLIERMEHRRAAARTEFAERFETFDSATTRDALAALLATGTNGS